MSAPKWATRRDMVQACCVLLRQWLRTLDDEGVSAVLTEWTEARAMADMPVAPALERDMTAEDILYLSRN